MEHDTRCEAQDVLIQTLRDRSHQCANWQAVSADQSGRMVQTLASNTESLNAHNLEMARLQGEMHLLCSKIPNDLVKEFALMQQKLDTVHVDFLMLRRQVYGVIGAMLMALIAAAMKWVIGGGLK